MKYLFLIVFFALIGLGCSKPKTIPPPIQTQSEATANFDGPVIPVTTSRTKGAPAWIDNADREGRLTAVGIAEPNGLKNKAMQREVAVNRGMAQLAKKISTEVEGLYQELQAISNHEGKKIPAINEISNTIRTVVQVRVKGAQVPYFWTDSQDGTLYCLLQLRDATSQEILREVAVNQPSLREAIKDLDATLDKKGK